MFYDYQRKEKQIARKKNEHSNHYLRNEFFQDYKFVLNDFEEKFDV
ncbi:hypothetical protein B835_898 [Enterococcus mundtii 3F]|nr:hypothetical protein [Enterococcus mundtii 3F]